MDEVSNRQVLKEVPLNKPISFKNTLKEPIILKHTCKRKLEEDRDEENEITEQTTIKKSRSSLNWENLDTKESKDMSKVSEYSNVIFDYLYKRESALKITNNYLLNKKSRFHVRPVMRSILVDWLIEVHEKFQCVPETLLLALNIMDRFLSKNKVSLSKLQLLAVTSLFIAAKFEEINAPKLVNYSYITDGAASVEDIKNAEMFMLESLNFDISWPNPMNFLRRISKADNYNTETRSMSKFILEYAYCCPQFIHLKASMVSALAFYIAKRIAINGTPNWDDTFIHYSGHINPNKCDDFKKYSTELINEIANPSTKLQALVEKYKKQAVYDKVHTWCSSNTTTIN